MEKKKLCRSTTNKRIGGVCAGISEYFGWDPTIVRLIWAFLILCVGTGILLYLVLWFVLPKDNQ